MESLFIELIELQACVFESVDGRFDSVCIKGEEKVPIKQDQVTWFIRELLDNLGVDDLQDWSVTVVYDPIASALLPSVLSGLFPHKPAGLEVRSLEALMPEVLLKHKLIVPGQTVTAALGSLVWQVALAEDGRVSGVAKLDAVNPEIHISERDIPAALCAGYTFTSNHKEVEQLEVDLSTLTAQFLKTNAQFDNCICHTSELQQEIEIKKQDIWILKESLERESNNSRIYLDAINDFCKLSVELPNTSFRENLLDDLYTRRPGSFFNPYLTFFSKDCRRITQHNRPELSSVISKIENSLVLDKIFLYIYNYCGLYAPNEFIETLLENSACPLSVFDKYYDDSSDKIRRLVANNQNCPVSILEILSEDKIEVVRNIAKNRLNII